ncbi:MAG TPA: SpoIIE family protein phosphatase [Solirubrobacteraceae bacterium]|nr:SpoIIE family protein phosphatase [Solirubrobacteraceae bacterium]
MAPTLTELVLDRAHNAVIWLDERGCVTYWNPSAQRIFGISAEQALGRPVASLIIPERLRAAHEAGIERFLADGTGAMLDRRIEMPALRADGTEFPVEMTISALPQEPGWLFSAFIQDVTDRVQADRERGRLVEELRQALHGSQRQFDAIVGALSDPVTIRDRDHRLIYANRAGLDYLGLDSVQQLRETSAEQIMDAYEVRAEDGTELSMDDVPSVRILRGEEAEPLLIRTVDQRTHEERWNLLKAAPLLGADGTVEATIMVIEDVTEHKRAERRAAFLARASELLASSLDYEQTLRTVAELAVPDIVDWCAVDLFDEDGDRVPVAVAHTDPARVALAEELRAYRPDRLDPDQGLGAVQRTGEPILYPDIPDELLRRSAADEHHLELLRKVGMRSVVLVPMKLGRQILGALTMVSAESGRALESSDLAVAEQIAARAAVAIENARLFGERARIARVLQESLIPTELPEIDGYELASAYLPAVQGTEVGGDFYDAWAVDDGWMITIGDVTGKGVEAAALTSLARHTLRTASEFVSSPAALLARLDGTLRRTGAMSICTALCVRLRGDEVTLAAGGHPLPLQVSADSITALGEHGPLLGGLPDLRWQDTTVRLSPGTTLVLYTDGVTDACDESGARFGAERLTAVLAAHRDQPAAGVVAALVEAISAFQVGPHADDVAILAVRYTSVDAGGDDPPATPDTVAAPAGAGAND